MCKRVCCVLVFFVYMYCFRTEGSAEGEPLAIDHRGFFLSLKGERKLCYVGEKNIEKKERREFFGVDRERDF